MVGRTVSHYEILEKLGEGGMGQVYKARDQRLHRIVALKILPPEAVSSPERRRRFEQEARAASALSHPNIVTIFDIEHAEGVDYIAMEYVKGKSLEKAIGHKGLRLQDALHYAVQIADALSAAHTAGIVHRDIKPGNIMITDTNQVKLLDFGVAKLVAIEETDDMSGTRTMNAPRTEQGAILGTVAYMSPEQAEGLPVDKRSDIFSFGSVLYEMVTGKRAFEGETKLSTMMAIMQKEPRPITEVVEQAPAEVEKIIARCLRKDRERRLQHMDDVKTLLQELKEETDSGRITVQLPVSTQRPPQRRRPRWPWVAGGATVLAGACAALYWFEWRQTVPGELVLTRLTADAGVNGCATLSTDGRMLAYCSDRSGDDNLDIWVRHLGGGTAIRLTKDLRDDVDPAFSPDGGLITFRSEREGGGVYVVPTLGGEERRIATAGRRPRFSPDGKWIAYWTGQTAGLDGKIFIVSAAGGLPRQVQPDFVGARWPVWSPDGTHLLFWGRKLERLDGGSVDWYVVPADGGPAVSTNAFAAIRAQRLNSLPQVASRQYIPSDWTPDGVYFAAGLGFGAGYNTNIFRLALTGSFQPKGRAERLTFGSDLEMDPSARSGAGVVFSRYMRAVDVWSLPVAANQGKPTGDFKRLTRDGMFLALSPSARACKVAYASYRTGRSNIYLLDLDTGNETQIGGGDQIGSPSVSPDGKVVAYTHTVTGKRTIEVVGSSGGTPQVLCEDCGWVTDWSPDSKWLLYRRRTPPGINLIEVATGKISELLVRGKDNIGDARVSPDGRWVAFQISLGGNRSNIHIAPFRGSPSPAAEWIPVTDGHERDYLPAWSPDGNLLYFISDRDAFRCIWAQHLAVDIKRPLGSPFVVSHLHSHRRSLMALWDAVSSGLSITADRLVLSQTDVTSELWMATWERADRK